jgi:hypothetical protein
MKTYLFIESSPHKAGWFIRPVSYDRPDDDLIPTHIAPTRAALEWLAKYGAPTWISGGGKPAGVANCKILAQSVGSYPDPIDVPGLQKLATYRFNDSVERIK